MRDLDPKELPDPRLADPAGAGSEPPHVEVSENLAGFHEALCRRLDEAGRVGATSMDPRSAAPPYDLLLSALSEHVAVMERVVHPELRRLGDERRAQALTALAAELVRAMRGMEQHLYGDARAPRESLPELHARLLALLGRHAEVEEAALRDAEAVMDVDERQRLADLLEKAARHAPTRPHPHVPHTPWLVPLAFTLSAYWDDALDAMDVRQVSGRRRRSPKPVGMWGSYLLGAGMRPESDDVQPPSRQAAPPAA